MSRIDELDIYVPLAVIEIVESLEEEIERLRADAERYRYLRAQHWESSSLAVVVRPKEALKLGSYSPSEELLDDEVDAAMRGEQPIW